jgi:hypothetical protein
MSLNEGTNFTLTASVFCRFCPKESNVKVEAIMSRAIADLHAIEGVRPTLRITDQEDDLELIARRARFLGRFMTPEQIVKYLAI